MGGSEPSIIDFFVVRLAAWREDNDEKQINGISLELLALYFSGESL
jgi:hypothetical protein